MNISLVFSRVSRRFIMQSFAVAGLLSVFFPLCGGAADSESLKAYYLEVDSPPARNWTGLQSMLSEAGFDTEALPLDRDPSTLNADLIVIGSFANTKPDYVEYQKEQAKNLLRFVEQGGVLLQFAQNEESQISLPFLPEDMRASRGDAQLSDIRIIQSDHPLLAGLSATEKIDLPSHLGLDPAWHVFMEQKGCGMLLGAGGEAAIDNPVLLEAGGGKGRFLLTSLFFDRLASNDGKSAPMAYVDLARTFSRNLYDYVREAGSGKAPQVNVTPSPEPWPFVKGSWTLAVLPDTQYYSRKYPEVFEAQTQWIAKHAKELNIKYVLHLGDITHNNTEPQWEAAKKAMSVLDGVVPYAMVGGNHDYGPEGNSAARETFFSDYFPVSKFEKWPTFGGVMEEGKIDNSYHLFEAGGEKWIVIALEWAPRQEAVEWADRLLTRHSDCRGILITHGYLYADNTRYDFAKYGRSQGATPHSYKIGKLPGGANDGEELWQKLVRKHPNMVMTINGHVLKDGVGRLSSKGEHGNMVHQMLVNYQRMRPQNGNGFLRLYEFLPDGRTIQARSYSPLWNVYKTDVQNQFKLEMSDIISPQSR